MPNRVFGAALSSASNQSLPEGAEYTENRRQGKPSPARHDVMPSERGTLSI